MENREEMVKVILPDQGQGRYVEGAMNGVNFRIPTGMPVEIPLRIWRVLEASRRESANSQQLTRGFTVSGGLRLQ